MFVCKFARDDSKTLEMLARFSAAFQKQITIMGTSTPAFTLKTRGLKGYRLLTRLEKILGEMESMQETYSVV